MPTTYIVAGFVFIFIIIGVIWSVKYKNAFMERIEKLQDETTLFEGDMPHVKIKSYRRTGYLTGSLVRITNKRIIIAQKALFQSRHAIRYVVIFEEPGNVAAPEGIAGGVFTNGYVTIGTKRDDITLVADPKEQYISITPVPESMGDIGIPRQIALYPEKADEIMRLLKSKPGF